MRLKERRAGRNPGVEALLLAEGCEAVVSSRARATRQKRSNHRRWRRVRMFPTTDPIVTRATADDRVVCAWIVIKRLQNSSTLCTLDDGGYSYIPSWCSFCANGPPRQYSRGVVREFIWRRGGRASVRSREAGHVDATCRRRRTLRALLNLVLSQH